MNVLQKFTIQNLKLNKKRTIVTIIGIILSTALICAVAGVFSSFQQTLIKHAIMADGDYHTTFINVPKDEQKYITENRKVESYFVTQGVGYAKLENSQNDYKPYLYLMEFDKTALNNYGLQLVEGRMPENNNEIIISEYIEKNGGVKYKVGDKITLDISKRISEGYELNQNNPYNNPKDSEEDGYMEEHLEKMYTKEFTIVGIIERPNMEIEDYSAPGYTIITVLDEIGDNINISVKYDNIRNTYKNAEEIVKGKDISYHNNSELLRWSGVTRAEDTMTVLYGMVGIVIVIIIVSSVFVIRNSFAISITEKMKQYGMLASIGATKKQIKNNVLFEGFILGLIGIPIGILCGMLATYILLKITTLLLGEQLLNGLKLIFSMPIEAIIISILLGGITIFLSSITSARRAAKISPIEAIRSNEDIKIKSKKLKTPKIIKKLFGIGGEIAYKNLKRNKKKYRTTVISLVVSITIFISLTTFMQYTFGMSNIYYKKINYNAYINIYYNINEDKMFENYKKAYEQYRVILEKYNIKEYGLIRYVNVDSDIDKYITEDYEQYAGTEDEKYKIDIKSIGEYAYKELIEQMGGKYEDYENKIIYCNNSYLKRNQGKDMFNFKEGDKIKITTSNGITKELEIAKITEEKSEFLPQYSNFGDFIISDKMLDEIDGYYTDSMYINAEDPDKVCEELQKNYDELQEHEYNLFITNYKEIAEENNRLVLLISIFLYGFITVITLIGVTNIFNTITTNMNLRSKEFAMLKSIGMTKKEFNKMIRLESIFYGLKSLIIGILLGTGISFAIYRIVIRSEATEGIKFIFPTTPIIISIVFIMIIVGIIMKYSLNKINKQNIIETIRKDNI